MVGRSKQVMASGRGAGRDGFAYRKFRRETWWRSARQALIQWETGVTVSLTVEGGVGVVRSVEKEAHPGAHSRSNSNRWDGSGASQLPTHCISCHLLQRELEHPKQGKPPSAAPLTLSRRPSPAARSLTACSRAPPAALVEPCAQVITPTRPLLHPRPHPRPRHQRTRDKHSSHQ